ncbi:IS3 family transposase [Metasolibacillus meyeri]|uniref:IS3 family transposase n=1 Tax=Metasolibacillus meyeri TaxID=1071052 RepID=UPI000D319815|nr:IS3 family transposase [Metasolibacillus meyeri]
MKKKQAIFQWIEKQTTTYPVTTLFQTVEDVSRSGYYKWKKERHHRISQKEKDQGLLAIMQEQYALHGGNLGNKRLKFVLDALLPAPINIKKIRRMRAQYHLPLLTKKRVPRPSGQPHVEIGNLLNRNFEAKRPGIKYSIDITYLPIKQSKAKFLYLCAIKDLYNNEIVAYQISERQDLQLVLDTVDQLKEKGPEKYALLHSDQGTQFTSPLYMKRLRAYNLTQSMSRRGNCWDNACIESFFGKLKTELPGFTTAQTKQEVLEAVTNYMQYYNELRLQLKLKTTPVQFRLQASK